MARIASAAQPSIRREQEMESLVQLASDSAQSLVHEVMGLEEAYKKFGVRYVPRQEDDVVLRAFRRGNLMGVPTVIWEWGVAARALVEKGGITFFIATGYGGELREDGTIQIGCGHVVGHRVGLQDHLDDRWLWISEPVQVGSAAEERERAEIVAHVREDFPKALAWFERVVAGSG